MSANYLKNMLKAHEFSMYAEPLSKDEEKDLVKNQLIDRAVCRLENSLKRGNGNLKLKSKNLFEQGDIDGVDLGKSVLVSKTSITRFPLKTINQVKVVKLKKK